MNENIRISLDMIDLDIRNPRLKENSGQEEAIKLMLKNQKDKIYNLAKDIAERGLNPSENIIVKKQGDKYVVLEGNRRVASMKLLKNPNLLEKVSPELFRRFKPLFKKIKSGFGDEISCVNLNEKDALHWINLKHTGENLGIGTVPWTTQQQKLFTERYTDTPSKEINVLKLIEKHSSLDKSYKNKLGNISLTNLDRMISDKNFKKTLGISFNKDKVTVTEAYSPDRSLKYLEELSKDLIDKKITVKDIYTKEDRINYLGELSNRVDQRIATGEDTELQPLPEMVNNNIVLNSRRSEQDTRKNIDYEQNTIEKNNGGEKLTEKIRAVTLTKNRKYLIPSTFSLKISSSRINSIFKELKTMDINIYTNSVGVLFRVFLELSLDWFIKEKKLVAHSNDSLSKKMSIARDYCQQEKMMDKNELHAINVAIATKNHLFSANNLNSYVHNLNYSPSAIDLKTHWDNFQKFIEVIWGSVEVKEQEKKLI